MTTMKELYREREEKMPFLMISESLETKEEKKGKILFLIHKTTLKKNIFQAVLTSYFTLFISCSFFFFGLFSHFLYSLRLSFCPTKTGERSTTKHRLNVGDTNAEAR